MDSSTLVQSVLETAITLQQIPAPTFDESARANAIVNLWRGLGLEVSSDETGNVYTCLRGRSDRSPVVLSAHLDSVFPKDTPLDLERTPQRIIAPGLGDNAIALAALVEVARRYQAGELKFAGDVHLVANVGEEGLGNLKGMRAVTARFGDAPRAYIVLEGLALGVIYHRGLGVQRYRITAHTRGGHSWADYGRPSAIHVLARLVAQLDALALPKQPRTSLNVGRMQGGVSINTIAPRASIELDLRSEDPDTLDWLAKQVNVLVSQANQEYGVRMVVENLGQRPSGSLPKDHWLVKIASACLQANNIRPRLMIGSTDANVPLSLGYPAICIGLTRGGHAHTLQEYIEIAPLAAGMAQLFLLLARVWKD